MPTTRKPARQLSYPRLRSLWATRHPCFPARKRRSLSPLSSTICAIAARSGTTPGGRFSGPLSKTSTSTRVVVGKDDFYPGGLPQTGSSLHQSISHYEDNQPGHGAVEAPHRDEDSSYLSRLPNQTLYHQLPPTPRWTTPSPPYHRQRSCLHLPARCSASRPWPPVLCRLGGLWAGGTFLGSILDKELVENVPRHTP